jgi:hypothetical protein
MIAAIQTGQIVGSIVGNVVTISCGVYLCWVVPRRLRRDLAAGKLSDSDAQAKLKKCKLGYAFFGMAVINTLLLVT